MIDIEQMTWEEREERIRLDDIKQRFAKYERGVEDRGLSIAHRQCTLENFQFHGSDPEQARQQDLLNKLNDYAAHIPEAMERGVGIVLFGNVGSGKDHCLVGICRRIMEAGFNCAYMRAIDMWNCHQATAFSKSLESSKRFMDKLKLPKVLHISDPFMSDGTGKIEPLSAFRREFLFDLIDHRSTFKRPTFLSLNVAHKDQFIAATNARIVDRCVENAIVHFCNWSSFRKPFDGWRSNESA